MYLKREESSRAFLPVWSVHLHRRFTPCNVHTLIECDARRSASVRCARLVGCSSPSGGSTPLFYRFSGGVLYARLPPRVWGLPRRPLRLVASRGSPPPRHVVCPLRRLPSLVGLRALAPVALAAVAMVPRCTLGGPPQPLHIYHVLGLIPRPCALLAPRCVAGGFDGAEDGAFLGAFAPPAPCRSGVRSVWGVCGSCKVLLFGLDKGAESIQIVPHSVHICQACCVNGCKPRLTQKRRCKAIA